MWVKLTISALEPNGICSLSGKECEVLVVAFDDGTVSGPLSQKALIQLLRMKLGGKKAAAPLAAVPIGNGEPVKK